MVFSEDGGEIGINVGWVDEVDGGVVLGKRMCGACYVQGLKGSELELFR
jgi:hypothetical protein